MTRPSWMSAALIAACCVMIGWTEWPPTTTASAHEQVLQADPPNEAALRIAQQAFELRFSEPIVALHLLRKALTIDDHEEVAAIATEILEARSFTDAPLWETTFDYEVHAVALHPDGELIAVGTSFGEIFLLDAEGDILFRVEPHGSTIDDVEFSPDGTMLAAGSHDDYFTIWRLVDGELREEVKHFYGDDWVRDLAFTPDGRQLIVAGDMYYSLVYDLNRRMVTDTLAGHDYYVYSVAVSETGQYLAAGDGDGKVKIWRQDAETWTEHDSLYLSGRVMDLTFLAGNELLVGGDVGQVLKIDAQTMRELDAFESMTGQDIYAVHQIEGAYLGAGSFSRISVFQAGEKEAIVTTDAAVYDLEPWPGAVDQFVVCVGSNLKLTRLEKLKAMTLRELRAQHSLPALSLDEELRYNLWEASDFDDLSQEETLELLASCALEIENPGWNFTDQVGLKRLAAKHTVGLLGDYFSLGDDMPGAIRNEIPRSIFRISTLTADIIRYSFEAAAGNQEKAAAEAMAWLHFSSMQIMGDPEFRKYAVRRAYHVYPEEKWALALSELATEELRQIEAPFAAYGYGCDANSVSFSPNGDYVYVSTDRDENCEGGYLYPMDVDGARTNQVLYFPNQSGIMWQGSFSRDGQRIASASTDGTVIIYNLNGQTESIFANEGGEVPFTDARILRNGDVITSDNNGYVLRWRMGDIVPEAILMKHQREARKLAVLSDETTILSIGFDGVLRRYRDGEVDSLTFDESIEDIAINQAETQALIGFVGGKASLIDLASWSETLSVADDDYADYQCVVFGPEDGYFIVGTEQGEAKAFSLNGGLRWSALLHEGTIYDLALSPDGQFLASAGSDDHMRLWKIDDLGENQALWVSQSWEDQVLSSSAWGQFLNQVGRNVGKERGLTWVQEVAESLSKGAGRDALLTAISQSIFFEWTGRRIEAKGGLLVYSGLPGGVNGIHWSGEREAAVAMCESGPFYEIKPDGSFEPLGTHFPGGVRAVTHSPDQGWFAAANNGSIYRLNEEFVLTDSVQAHGRMIYDVAVSPDGQYYASASADNAISVFSTANNEEVARMTEHQEEANAVAFLPDGQGLISSADDYTVRFWDLQGNLARTENLGAAIWSLGVSADGERIAAGTSEGEIVLLDGEGTLYKRWSAHESAVWTLEFSPAGDRFVSSGNDGQVMVWTNDGAEILRFDTGESTIFDAAFSPDGQVLYVGTSGGEVFRFELE